MKFKTYFPAASVAVVALFIFTLGGCSSPPEGMIEIPAGEFLMGSDKVDKAAKAIQYGNKKPWYLNEHPARKVNLDQFHIDKTEITNVAYKKFIDEKKKDPPPYWLGGSIPNSMGDHPVTMVTWFEAKAYCEYAGKRLPTEAEWEKAARGTDGRNYPWGEEFDIKKVNTFGEYGGTTSIGSFKDGASPYGLSDMAGNAQEWVDDFYTPYPGNEYDDKDYGKSLKVVRGGSWGGIGHYGSQVYVRAAYRNYAPPGGRYDDVGFRCAW